MDDANKADARAAIKAFLRDRRERALPVSQTRARRGPGLSREDVARRAQITAKWYVLIETGRASGVSTKTLDAIADALALDARDRRELHRLAAAVFVNPPAGAPSRSEPPPKP